MDKHIKVCASSCLDMIDAFKNRIDELEISSVEGSINIHAAEEFNENFIDPSYIDELMQYVSDEVTTMYDSVLTYENQQNDIKFIITSLQQDMIQEYICPKLDLSGNIDTDIQYILDSIDG